MRVKKYLDYLPKGKKFNYDFNPFDIKLTSKENKIIKYWLINKQRPDLILPDVIPVSERLHLDFIGWDNPEYNDVLLCKTENHI